MADARGNPAFGNAGDDSAQIHSHPEEKTEQLRDQLADFLFEMDEEDFDSGRLDALLAALGETEPQPEFHRKHASDFTSVGVADLPPQMIPERFTLAQVIAYNQFGDINLCGLF